VATKIEAVAADEESPHMEFNAEIDQAPVRRNRRSMRVKARITPHDTKAPKGTFGIIKTHTGNTIKKGSVSCNITTGKVLYMSNNCRDLCCNKDPKRLAGKHTNYKRELKHIIDDC